jgi:hypothetical protein
MKGEENATLLLDAAIANEMLSLFSSLLRLN